MIHRHGKNDRFGIGIACDERSDGNGWRSISSERLENHRWIGNADRPQLLGNGEAVLSARNHDRITEKRRIGYALGGLLQERLFAEKGEKLLGVGLA